MEHLLRNNQTDKKKNKKQSIQKGDNSKTQQECELTVDGKVDRTGHHCRRRLWPIWTEVQLSLTPEHCSTVTSVRGDGDGG